MAVEDIVNFVNALKEQPGGDIHLAGGARLAASMTLDTGNTDKLAEFRAEALRLGGAATALPVALGATNRTLKE